MAKAQSIVTSTEYDSTTNTVTVTVKHVITASYSRSVRPVAWKAFKANARTLGWKGARVNENMESATKPWQYGDEISEYPCTTLVRYTAG